MKALELLSFVIAIVLFIFACFDSSHMADLESFISGLLIAVIVWHNVQTKGA